MTRCAGFEQYGVIELNAAEMMHLNGGEAVEIPKWLRKLSPWAVVGYIADNWPDIKKGFTEGWNADQY